MRKPPIPFRRNKSDADAEPTPEQRLLEGAEVPSHTAPLNLDLIYRNIVAEPDGLWAWYVIEGVDWLNRDDDARKTILANFTQRISELGSGIRIQFRGTASPFPFAEWARKVDETTADRRLPDRAGRTFGKLLTDAQTYMFSTGASRYGIALGIRFSTMRVTESTHLALITGAQPIEGKLGDFEPARKALIRVNHTITRRDFAKPMSTKALGWLIHASLGMGTPAPATSPGSRKGYDPDEVHGFTGPVAATAAPYALSTEVRAIRNSRLHTSHVVVLNAETIAGRSKESVFHAWLPWLYFQQTMEFPVETCAIFDLFDGEDLLKAAEDTRSRARHIAQHDAEADHDSPSTNRAIQRASATVDEMMSPHREVAARAVGIVMFAVTGATEEEALERADTLASEYAREQKITLVQAFNQYQLYRSFTPGERPVMTGYVTQMPVSMLATAVPHASAHAGDSVGFPLGPIGGSSELFVWDTHLGPRTNRSGLVLVSTDLGGGKSSFLVGALDWQASIGDRCVVFDPSWPLGRLTQLPHLKDDARLIDLASAKRGMMVPSLLIPEPHASVYDTTDEFNAAVADAAHERKELLLDTSLMLLPHRMVAADHNGELVARLEDATNELGGHYGADPWELVDLLKQRGGEMGKIIATRLAAAAEMRLGAPIFPTRGTNVSEALLDGMFDSRLTVLTMRGLELPPKEGGLDPSQMSQGQRASRPILHLGARLAIRSMYAPGPVTIGLDEGTILTEGGGTMRGATVRMSNDSRKNDTLVLFTAPKPSTLLALDPDIGNLSGMALMGRMGNESSARAALPLLRRDADSGYHHTLLNLEPGHFLVRDWEGRVRTVYVDQRWWDESVVEAANTTPAGGRVVTEGVGLFTSEDYEVMV